MGIQFMTHLVDPLDEHVRGSKLFGRYAFQLEIVIHCSLQNAIGYKPPSQLIVGLVDEGLVRVICIVIKLISFAVWSAWLVLCVELVILGVGWNVCCHEDAPDIGCRKRLVREW